MARLPRFVRSSPLPIPRPWWGPGLFLAALLMPLPAAAAGLAAPPPGLLWAGLMAIVGVFVLVAALATVVFLLVVLGKQFAVDAVSRTDLRAEVAAVRAESVRSQAELRDGIQGEFRALREEIRALDEAVNKILRMMGEK